MAAISRAINHSNSTITKIRERLAPIVDENDIVITCGSYARREASLASDIDFFLISEGAGKPSWVGNAYEAIRDIVPNPPAADGAFGTLVQNDEMISNIGGDKDTNQNITHRILFLLEGEWLFNEIAFRKLRKRILQRYIADSITDHQLALFLLNDIIRYYRTVAIDYEFKTAEQSEPKPWAIRNIKLIFSRKLLYASGMFSIALTADAARDKKIETLEGLFDKPVLERMEFICGETAFLAVRTSYNHFISKLEDQAFREQLDGLKKEERNHRLFRDIKNEGHHFTQSLLRLFETTFGASHPIRKAVIF